jgi:hypothetical protein
MRQSRQNIKTVNRVLGRTAKAVPSDGGRLASQPPTHVRNLPPLRRNKESPDMALTDTEHIAVQDMVEEIDAIMRNAREGNSHRGEVLAELAGRVMGLYIAQGRRFGVGDDRVMIDDVTKRAVAFANSAAQL